MMSKRPEQHASDVQSEMRISASNSDENPMHVVIKTLGEKWHKCMIDFEIMVSLFVEHDWRKNVKNIMWSAYGGDATKEEKKKLHVKSNCAIEISCRLLTGIVLLSSWTYYYIYTKWISKQRAK